MIRILELDVLLELTHRCKNSIAIPGLPDPLCPDRVRSTLQAMVNLGSSPANPGLGIGKMQLVIALTRLSQGSTREDDQPRRGSKGFGLKPLA